MVDLLLEIPFSIENCKINEKDWRVAGMTIVDCRLSIVGAGGGGGRRVVVTHKQEGKIVRMTCKVGGENAPNVWCVRTAM